MTLPSEHPSKSVSEHIAELLTRSLFLGSGGYALFSLTQNHYLKALIALGLSTASGLVSSFGKGLMDTLNERWTKRGQKLGEVIDESVERVLDNIFQPKDQYLEALKHYCHDLEVEGLKGDFPSLPLEDVFVPIRLDSDPAAFSGSTSIKQIWSLLPQKDQTTEANKYCRMAIIADPGYGKTTLTRYLSLQYAQSSYEKFGVIDLLPFLLIYRRLYKDIQHEQMPMLPNLLQEQVKKLPRCHDLEISADWFEQRLKAGQCLILLDGLDEVPETHRKLVSQWTNWQMQTYPSQFILTSRPHGYDESLFRGVERISIIDFNIDQKEDFINKWYKAVLWKKKWNIHWQWSQIKTEKEKLSLEQAKSQSDAEAEEAAKKLLQQIIEVPNLNELAKNPLLITIIAATHRAFSSLPVRRVEIYKKMFEHLLDDRPNYRETPLTVRTTDENLIILQQLAFALTKQGRTQFTVKQASPLLQSMFVRYNPELELTPAKFLGEIQKISGLLTGEDSDLYQFSHKTFQEYLTALFLKQNPKAQEFLFQKIKSGTWHDWEEVIRFYAAMTDANPFIKAILSTKDKNALLLGYRICIEVTDRLPSTLKEQLYQSLREVDLGKEFNARVKLEEQFQTRVPLDDKALISSDYITWMEYRLFLEDQETKQFHSQAKVENFSAYPPESRILNISQIDARWFCAWLSTQIYLHSEEATYLYRLPTMTELAQVRSPNSRIQDLQPWTTASEIPGNSLRVVRQQIDNRYKILLNFLANGRWKEADQETQRLMLELANRLDEGYLTVEALKIFPVSELELLDQLWLKFSGHKFGFSNQRELWLDVGGKLDFGEDNDRALKAHKKFCDRNGWRRKGEWLNYSALDFNLSAPIAHLPSLYRICRVSPKVAFGGSAVGWCAVLSRKEACLQQGIQHKI